MWHPGQANQGRLWCLYTAWTGAHRSAPNVSLFEAFREKLHQANQEGATDLLRYRPGNAAKLVDKIVHGLYSELGWQVSFQPLETLLQKYYPRDPAYEEALGGNSPQKKGSA